MSKSILRIEWDYPVYTPVVQPKKDGTHARMARKALSREDAFKAISGDDPRPLLVLRECKVCNGTDDALLKGGTDNEKTFLLSRWFHCVKLPVDVLDENHPFHVLFTQENPEHLFVCSLDGQNHDPLESETSRVELWKSMRGMLGTEYKSKPDASLKKISSLLNKMDVVDQKIRDLNAKHEDVLEDDGPDSRKLPKLLKKLAKAELEGNKLQAEVEKATKLELRRRTDAKTGSASSQ
ncbi:MAG: hypothetical protein ACI841_001305 [Planctomycetota bacterium]|jgi:hypothetical protein